MQKTIVPCIQTQLKLNYLIALLKLFNVETDRLEQYNLALLLTRQLAQRFQDKHKEIKFSCCRNSPTKACQPTSIL